MAMAKIILTMKVINTSNILILFMLIYSYADMLIYADMLVQKGIRPKDALLVAIRQDSEAKIFKF